MVLRRMIEDRDESWNAERLREGNKVWTNAKRGLSLESKKMATNGYEWTVDGMLALAFSSIGQTNTHATRETCHVLEAMTLASHEFTRH